MATTDEHKKPVFIDTLQRAKDGGYSLFAWCRRWACDAHWDLDLDELIREHGQNASILRRDINQKLDCPICGAVRPEIYIQAPTWWSRHKRRG